MRLGAALAAVTGTLCVATSAARGASQLQIYWSNQASGTIGEARLDGIGVDQSFITGADLPFGIAVDGGGLYWANAISIGQAGAFNGMGVNQDFIPLAARAIAVDGQHIYWTAGNDIGRANLDGTDVDPTFITGADFPWGIAVDGQHIYWANEQGGTIGRANIDGTDVDQSFIGGASFPEGVAIDNEHIYWADAGSANIVRCDLNGDACTFFEGTNASAIAVNSQHVFWTDTTTNDIYQANLDGSGVTTLITGADYPAGLAVSVPTAAVIPSSPPAFATTPQGSLSAPQTLTVTNVGPADLTVTGLSFAGADPSDFLVGSDTCLTPIASFESCQVTVNFAPQAQGARSATLELYSNDFANSPESIALSGTAGQLPQGPEGPAGPVGLTGAAGPQGPAAPVGAAGLTGVAGSQRAAGQVEFVTCARVTRSFKRHHHQVRVTREPCTARLVSGTVTFGTQAERDTLTRGRTVYATGSGTALGHGSLQLVLTPLRRLVHGRYTLTRVIVRRERPSTDKTVVTVG